MEIIISKNQLAAKAKTNWHKVDALAASGAIEVAARSENGQEFFSPATVDRVVEIFAGRRVINEIDPI